MAARTVLYTDSSDRWVEDHCHSRCGEEKVVESRGGCGFGSAVCLGKGETCVARVFRVSRVEGVLQREAEREAGDRVI